MCRRQRVVAWERALSSVLSFAFFSLAAAVSTPLSLVESDRFSNCQRLGPGCEDEKWFAFTGTDPASSTIRSWIQSEILDDSKGESASFPLRVLKSCKPQEPLAKLALFKLARWSYPRNSRILSCPLQKTMGGKVPSRVGRKRAVLDSFHYPVLSFPFLSFLYLQAYVPSCSIIFHRPFIYFLFSKAGRHVTANRPTVTDSDKQWPTVTNSDQQFVPGHGLWSIQCKASRGQGGC